MNFYKGDKSCQCKREGAVCRLLGAACIESWSLVIPNANSAFRDKFRTADINLGT